MKSIGLPIPALGGVPPLWDGVPVELPPIPGRKVCDELAEDANESNDAAVDAAGGDSVSRTLFLPVVLEDDVGDSR